MWRIRAVQLDNEKEPVAWALVPSETWYGWETAAEIAHNNTVRDYESGVVWILEPVL